MRSTRNQPHLFAAVLGADLVNLTVSGATTANILHTPQQTVTGREFAPQLYGLPPDADLVTWSHHQPDGPLGRMLSQQFANGLPNATVDDIELIAAGLAAVVKAVLERAPHARVVLVDYLTVVTEHTPTGDGAIFTDEELPGFLRTQGALAQAYRFAAARSGAELLAVSAISTGHGLGSDDPWVFGFQPDMATTAGSFHPNEAGMQFVADQLCRILG